MPSLAPAAAAIALCGVFMAPQALASLPLATKSGCMACHMVDKKLVGPALRDIGARYKGRADAMAYMAQRVRQGGPGVWGPIPMAPTEATRLSDADLNKLLAWILAGAK